jgi:hypothetical protein
LTVFIVINAYQDFCTIYIPAVCYFVELWIAIKRGDFCTF